MSAEIFEDSSALNHFRVDSTREVFEEGYDRQFLKYSSMCAEPLCRVFEQLRFRLVAPLDPTKFDNYESKVVEVAYRAFLVVAAVFATVTLVLPIGALFLGVTSKILRYIGFSLQKDDYTYIKGQAPERELNGQVKLATWNVGGIGGGMQYDHCGIIPWRLRLDSLVEKIVREDADVVVLQEIYDAGLLEALVEKLGPHYSHFFTHLGANLMGSVGGVMVLAKCPIHKFSNESFENNDWSLNRTFATIEVKERPDSQAAAARVIGTHLIHDSNENRLQQLEQIRASIREQRAIPTVIMGDLNLKKGDPQQGGVLDTFLTHSYDGETPTATNALEWQWYGEEKGVESSWIDYISRFTEFGGQFSDTHLIEAFDSTYNTKTALSDHNGIVTSFEYR